MEDMKAARSRVSFDVTQLTEYIYKGRSNVEMRRKMARVAESDPAFSKDTKYFLGRTQNMERVLNIGKRFVEILREGQYSKEEMELLRFFIDEYMPTTLHEAMFMPVIQAQGTDEQIREWIPQSERFEIIGCYAQTEIAHGSNLGGLETVAVFDRETDEFVMHSPSLTATKWWIGGLGIIATHALVQAMLIIEGKNYGPHLFVVPIRSLESHKPLEGVTVGDIGPKFGFQGVDNGFVRFNKVRVPRRNMLMRFASVDRQGNYSKPPHAKIAYGGMVLLRAQLADAAWYNIARAVTISTRYCIVRRQFSLGDSKEETSVSNYRMVQFRLFPLIANAYAAMFTGRFIMKKYKEMENQLRNGIVDLLPQVHAISSGLKSYATTLAGESIEEARKVMGGHGFSMFSGIPLFFLNYIGTNTYEGENFILTQQLSRFLLKEFKRALQSKSSSKLTQKYLAVAALDPLRFKNEKLILNSDLDLFNSNLQIKSFEHRVARLVAYASDLLEKKKENWNDVNVECANITRAHGQYLYVLNFIEALEEIKQSNPQLFAILSKVKDLYVLYTIEKESGDFLCDGFMTCAQLELVRNKVRFLLKELQSDVIGLVDAFDFPDYLLHSALGKYDGNVYETITPKFTLKTSWL
ncbi:acyl-CoA oxidase [Rozella allomycis CSF55]|uniref:Acyl-coenzyme A oxidase n=1 Tax=Rozella allomycis (strain CSF55) TaxID=988480 RepID=A0A4P9YH16_ROZAC|nr:acyl-CoA oxidase [Rozella allomycis CSF55]